jgi:UPF0042 nucleotide-binding protein
MPPCVLPPEHASALIQTVITSYGVGHHDAPCGNALLVDTRPLRNPPADPAVRERMLRSTGLDPFVRDYVLATPGALRLIERGLQRALALLALDDHHRRTDIHVLCRGGLHRSVVVAEELATGLRTAGHGVETEHRHIDRPVLPTWKPDLTDHELAALRLLARGHTHTQIAAILKVRPQTGGLLLHGARTSLHARTLPHAIAIGYETDILRHARTRPPSRAGQGDTTTRAR